jgi:hypothetical protein
MGMPLTVHFGDGKARWIRQRAVFVKSQCRHDLFPGGFVIARNSKEATALATVGAVTCVIIVMHRAPGIGALAHVAATDPNVIVSCARTMGQQLVPPVADVVLSAGQVHEDATQQQAYQTAIVSQLRGLSPRVSWPAPQQDEVWGACYYLPLSEEVAFTTLSVGDIAGTGAEHADGGISVHPYAT